MKKKLIILQFNEVNFDLVKKYISKGYLKNFEYFIKNFNLVETSSESKYENLEPWIQWVSFYTGKKFKDHQVSHLNDFDKKQWNFLSELEKKYKKKLALLFPMNLKNNFSKESIFLPDPWTETKANCDFKLKKIYKIFKKIILQNASNKINFFDFISLGFFSFFNTSLKFKIFIIKNFKKIIKYKFYKALVFDYLCWEIFKNTEKGSFDVLTLFLNSCAHVQHHYFLNSSVKNFQKKNPLWYINNIDPILECLNLYDKFLFEFKNLKNLDFILITGLSQTPIDRPEFYYNLKNHLEFFKKINLKFTKIIKRMSRDYTLYFKNENEAKLAKDILSSIELNGLKFFSAKNIENKIYLELIYNEEIKHDDKMYIDNKNQLIIREFVNFIAIKNSIHNQKGYLISSIKDYKSHLNISNVYKNILKYYEI